MTRIGKPVIRETASLERGHPIVIALHPKYIEIRLKQQRNSYRVDYGAVLWLAVKRQLSEAEGRR